MGAEEELARSLARFDATSREYADRRALQEREQAAARASVREGFAKQGATMEKFIEHLQELGKRKRKAGGWDTSSATSDKPVHFSFASSQEDTGFQVALPQRPVLQPDSFSSAAMLTPRQAEESSAGPPTEPLPTEPAAAEPPAAGRRARRAAREDDFDEDDFSNQSWMR